MITTDASKQRPKDKKARHGPGAIQALCRRREVWIAALAVLGWFLSEPLWVVLATSPDEVLKELPCVRLHSASGAFYTTLGPAPAELSPAAVNGALGKAVVAAEDGRFFRHGGVDFRGMARAFLVNATRSLRRGRPIFAQGASTITMQLVQLSLNRPEHNALQRLRNKIVEAGLAWKIEAKLAAKSGREHAKSEILAAYLEKVPFGHNITGAGSASRAYFGVAPEKLSLAQAAMLAGTIRAPSRLSPFSNPAGAVRERDRVLGQMVRFGLLAQKELDALDRKVFVSRAPRKPQRADGYILQAVRRELDQLYREGSVKKSDIETGRVRIDLTIDLRLQEVAERAVRAAGARLSRARGFSAQDLDCAAVVVDQNSGAILATVGGRSFTRHQYDCALQARRPPGSTFKAITYLTAFCEGESPTEPFWRDGQVWTLRQAFARSDNGIAVALAERTGLQKVRRFAEGLGFTIPAADARMVLGGFPVSHVKLTALFATVGNGGTYHDPFLIRGISVRDRQLYSRPLRSRRLAPSEACESLRACLREVFASGTASAYRNEAARLGLAGKTGTTDECRDAWFAGIDHKVALGVWVGHRSNQPMPAWVSGANTALPLWMEIMAGQ